MSKYIKNSQSGEDYLECVYLLSKSQSIVHRIDVAKRMGVSQPAVNKAMKLLVEKGYVYEDGKHLFLSEEGQASAQAVYEKHCLVRDFLVQLGVSPAVAAEDACHMEHILSEETIQAMKAHTKKS